MKKSNTTYIIMVFLASIVYASSSIAQVIEIPKTILVEYHPVHGLCAYHTVSKGNTIYSIGKAYQVEVLDITEVNPKKNLVSLQLGDEIRIPVTREFVDDFDTAGQPNTRIPVYYKAKKGDNLFRISRIYFDLSQEDVKKYNKMSSINLQPDQLVLVGYKLKPAQGKKAQNINQTKTVAEAQKKEQVAVKNKTSGVGEKSSKPETVSHSKPKDKNSRPVEDIRFEKIVHKPNHSDSTQDETEEQMAVSTKKLRRDNGVAVWNKQSQASGIFALHRDAEPGSQIEVYNPFSKKSLTVTVIGEIPESAYESNVRVILSPDTAKALGALDERFYVKMNYIK